MTTLHEVRPGVVLTGQSRRVRNRYPFFAGIAGTAPTTFAPAALTPGNVPGNLRVSTSANPLQDFMIHWDAVPASSTLTTLSPAASYARD